MSSDWPMQIDLSRIAHDLRGPLMPLRTAAWLLRNEPGDTARIRELAEIVDRQSVRLARMMDELGEWAHNGVAPMTLKREPIDARLALDLAIGGIPDCHVEAGVTPEAAAFRFQGDLHRLALLLRTLVEHAIHRDPQTPPEVSLSVVSGRLQIRVCDHGEPLDAAARHALLCQPQSDPFDGGLGLRLLLARRIAEAHGGTLHAEDLPQEGLAMICAFQPD